MDCFVIVRKEGTEEASWEGSCHQIGEAALTKIKTVLDQLGI